MHRLRRWWWLIPIGPPVLAYLSLILAAYIRPPLTIPGGSEGYVQPPMAVVEVENRGRWPVTLEGVTVQGVLPPDEVGAFTTVGGELAQVYSLLIPEHIGKIGELKGWQVGPENRSIHYGVKLVWYQNTDLRWLRCPVVRYHYLGWPMSAHGVCGEGLRGAATYSGPRPPALGEWGPWQSVAGGVRFRTQRLSQERGDDLWIEVEPDAGAPAVGLSLNRSSEEPAGGHARIRLRIVTIPDQPGSTGRYTIPLRWGEPTPEIEIEVIPISQLR